MRALFTLGADRKEIAKRLAALSSVRAPALDVELLRSALNHRALTLPYPLR
jgi:hypothetical protein